MNSWMDDYEIIHVWQFYPSISFTWHGIDAWRNILIRSIKPYWTEPDGRQKKEEFFETKKIGWSQLGPISIHIDTGKRMYLQKWSGAEVVR